MNRSEHTEANSESGREVAPSWRLLPAKPTDAMIEAYFETCERHGFRAHINASCAWEAMLAAAPTPDGASSAPHTDGSTTGSEQDLIDSLTKEVEGLRACLAGDREVRPMTEERLDRILDFVEFAKSVAGPNDTATLLWADQLALIDEAVIASRCRALSTSGRAG